MSDALLEVEGLSSFYGPFQALFGVSMHVEPGETIAIVGANSAGKTTFMKSLVGLVICHATALRFRGRSIAGLETNRIVELGISLVPEGRRLFRSLTVEENLLAGGQLGRRGPWSLARVYELFPVLRERRAQASLSLSGGQQQMVAIGRALMANPDLLLIDELSLGLAPIVVKDIYAILPKVVAQGTTAIIVEQDTGQALRAADRIYCLRQGQITLHGRPAEVTRDQIAAAYFGVRA